MALALHDVSALGFLRPKIRQKMPLRQPENPYQREGGN
jgi:hypothetical protein